MTDVSIEHLRFAPDILRRLGEELIPSPEQGILELVRNAYDADAVACTIELRGTDVPGGTIIVSDTGQGMTREEISDGWLIVGRSRKSNVRLTRRLRRPVGEKGLGRLAALRLGESAVLRTRPAEEPGKEYRITLDWSQFDSATVVEEVALPVSRHTTKESPGTTVELLNIRIGFGEREIKRLARALVLLADPFDDQAGFRPKLTAPGFAELEKLVQMAYFSDADFHLVAALDESGHANAQVLDWKGDVLWHANHETLIKYSSGSGKPSRKLRRGSSSAQLILNNGNGDRVYEGPAAKFELWNFLLKQESFHVRTAKVTELREWLEAVGGVHLYHRGLRVHPYGNAGHDWLDMNLARSRDPQERPSTNNSLGRVFVPDPGEELLQKTDRSGFVENHAFEEIRRFAQDALEWMADMRLRDRDSKRQSDRVVVPKQVTQARAVLTTVVQNIAADVRPELERAIEQFDKARDREVRVLREEVELYRTLGTVGTTVAVFAHESAKPLQQIEQMTKTLARRGQRELGARYSEWFEGPIKIVLRSVSALKTYAYLPLKLLGKDKRRVGRVDVHNVIRETIDLFSPFLEEAGIRTTVELDSPSPLVRGTISSIEAIITNLVTNAIAMLTGDQGPLDLRQLVIRTGRVRDRLLLRVLDNGPGVTGLGLDEIWLPGRTTRPDGTGLGLTIVRDAAADLGGRASVVARSELGGAEFIIDLPALEAD